ncbi:LamG domain-containing protein [Streptomyces sp. NBC_01808]|uniref:LamG domain-containing protein n=1 Tax=Streptomyces sp. NBC_01808 TaxID=2975947 RepID=UPI002DD96C5E|nr:LamG-like jellyroll fold domain-containing protein [Streptomyces sp. NBC_01808]WSA39560.1 LamG domain-containing protein [Streptomyces sp. NBC_01808]
MARHALLRSALVGAALSAVLAATPLTAAAAANAAPDRPDTADLTMWSRPCTAGPDRPYFNMAPPLRAVLHDPDGDSLAAQFELSWQDPSGEPQTRELTTTSKSSGSEFSWHLKQQDIPEDIPVQWRVRATDGTAWGPWSSDGGAGPCEFVYDTTSPAPPVISSPDYPEDPEGWTDGVGVPGRFIFDAPAEEAVKYYYSVGGSAPRLIDAPAPGEPVTVTWTPERSGVHVFEVQSVSRAGTTSAPASYTIRVSSGRSPVASWALGDAAGASEAAPTTGTAAATAGTGVTFGAAGPEGTAYGTAAALDGTPDAYLTPQTPVADTSESFAVAAWARPETAAEGGMTVLSQNGGATPASFALGIHDGRWSLAVADGTADPVRATGGAAATGKWAHLTAVYNAPARTARLYVDGRLAATAEGATAASTAGDLQVGRVRTAAGHAGNWRGRLADVRVWDRVVVADEAATLATRKAQRTGYWMLDEASDGTSPEYTGGQPLTLSDGAAVTDADPIAGTGHLELTGNGGYAATATPPVDTTAGYSVAAYVRFGYDLPTRDMTLFSLPGDHTNAVEVRYEADTGAWELVVADTDTPTATHTVTEAYANPWGQHVAVVHDDPADRIRLYTDGMLAADLPLPDAATWPATTGLQLGRARTPTGWTDPMTAAIDEVRTYTGALSKEQVAMIRGPWTDPDV